MTESIPTILLADGPATRPVVLCVPGAMCAPEVFSDMAQLTGCETHAIAWLEGPAPHDIPSVAARVAAIAGQFRRVILVGHSIGVPIAVLAARQCVDERAGLLAGLLLSNSGATTAGHGDIDLIIRRVQDEWGPAFWAQFLDRCIGTPLSPALMAQCLAYPPKLSATAVAQAIESQKSIDLRPLLQTMAGIPSAVVHGKSDKARTLSHAEELAAHLPGSQLHVMNTGHTSAAESPQQFADVVVSLLKNPQP